MDAPRKEAGSGGAWLRALTEGEDGAWKRLDGLIREVVDRLPRPHRPTAADRDVLATNVVEEVFNRFRKGKGPRTQAMLVPWLRAITHSRCVDTIRQRVRHRGSAVRLMEALATRQSRNPGSCPSASAYDVACLRTALRILHPDARRLLNLHYLEGLSHRDIAMQRKVRTSVVRKRISRALGILRRQLLFRHGEE